MHQRHRAFSVLVLSLLPHLGAAADRSEPERPKLAVLVMFDQFRGDYLERWESLYGVDGFRRLMKDGAWYQNCHYNYATTLTAPGHASIATGANPCRHGIIENEWFDLKNGVAADCVGSERYSRVPPAKESTDRSSASEPKACSPDNLLLPTLGDVLKEATHGHAKVVSLSYKDRSAVLLGGKRADACYWLDQDLFVTSTYYREKVHPWVEEFNHDRVVDRWFGKDWLRLRPDLDYEKYSGPDDQPGEGLKFLSRTFPHSLGSGSGQPGTAYYKLLYASPFGNELLLELAKRAIDGEKLGSHDVPDLLCLSFSCNDSVGHVWGPDSQEVLDVTLRSDQIMKELLAVLDNKVGKGKYVLAMSADHGVCPLPEVSRGKGKDAERITVSTLRKQAESFLDEAFPRAKTEDANPNSSGATDKDDGSDKRSVWFEGGLSVDNLIYPWLYLNRKTLKARGLKQEDVEGKLSDWFKKQPGIMAVYSRAQLVSGVSSDDEIGQGLVRSFYPDRSGDLAIIPKPYSLIYSVTGTTHGSPHSYDTHVVLLMYGAGIQAGIHKKPIIPQAATVLLARSLGIAPPQAAEATLAEAYLDGNQR